MTEVWIIIVACAGFVLFVAWAVLFAYCLYHRYRRRKLNNSLENCEWYAKQKYGDDIEMYPREDGLCQETIKRASLRFKRPDGQTPVNQDQSTTTTTAVVNEGFQYVDSDEKDKQYVEDSVRSPDDEMKPENYPDIIAAAEQSGVPDVVINTTEHGYQQASLAVPEYHKPTLQEKIDKSPDYGRKLELLGQHSPQLSGKSSFYEQLRAAGRSSEYEDLVSVGRTSSLDDLAPAYRKPMGRSGSAPSMSAREKVQVRKNKRRKPVSRSSSLNSILESDYEDNFAMAGSIESLIKQKRSKKKRRPLKDESHQETPVFSFFTPDSSSAGDITKPNTEGISDNAQMAACNEGDNIQQDSLKNDPPSSEKDGLENTAFVLQDNRDDIHLSLPQDPIQNESTKTNKDLTSSSFVTDQNSEMKNTAVVLQEHNKPIIHIPFTQYPIQNESTKTDKDFTSSTFVTDPNSEIENTAFVLKEFNKNASEVPQDLIQNESTKAEKDFTNSLFVSYPKSEMEFESVPVEPYSERQSPELQSTSTQQKTTESDNPTYPSGNKIREAASIYSNDESPSPITSEAKLEKTNAETKSLMHVEVDTAPSSHKGIIRRTSWAAEEGAQFVEDSNIKSKTQNVRTVTNNNLNSIDLVSTRQRSRTISNLIDKFQEKEANAPKSEIAKLEIEKPSVVRANENQTIPSNSFLGPRGLKNTSVNVQTESMQIVEENNDDAVMVTAKDELHEAGLPKQTAKELDNKTSTDLTKLTTTSAKTTSLPNPAGKRQFNIGHSPYTATGIGLNPVMSELLTRVTVTDSEPRHESSNSRNCDTSIADDNKASSSEGHASSLTNKNKDHSDNNSDHNVTSVIPEAPVFTAPLSMRKLSVPTHPDPSPKGTPSSQRRTSLQAPVRLDGGPAPVSGVALMSVMPELQNRLRRMSVQKTT